MMAIEKLENFFPKDKFEETIFLVIFLFLNRCIRKDSHNQEEKNKLIKELINLAKDSTVSISNSFSSFKLTQLIVNMIHFFGFILIYSILILSLLKIDGLNNIQIEKLIINNEPIIIRHFKNLTVLYFLLKR
jgi:hypothetical protein